MRNVPTAYWDAVSAMDADAVSTQFSEHACFRFGNTPPNRGRADIRRSFVQFFTRTAHISCKPVTSWISDACVVADADLSVIFDDGGALTIPITTIFCMVGQQIHEYRILFYPEPALEPAGSGMGRLR